MSEIKPYASNPRVNDAAVDAVAASLREFGFRQPIVVVADGVILSGHARFKAARKLGLEKVPVHGTTDLTPAQLKAYRIADNKTSDLSDWDFDVLPIELLDLQALDFDLGLAGFNRCFAPPPFDRVRALDEAVRRVEEQMRAIRGRGDTLSGDQVLTGEVSVEGNLTLSGGMTLGIDGASVTFEGSGALAGRERPSAAHAAE